MKKFLSSLLFLSVCYAQDRVKVDVEPIYWFSTWKNEVPAYIVETFQTLEGSLGLTDFRYGTHRTPLWLSDGFAVGLRARVEIFRWRVAMLALNPFGEVRATNSAWVTSDLLWQRAIQAWGQTHFDLPNTDEPSGIAPQHWQAERVVSFNQISVERLIGSLSLGVGVLRGSENLSQTFTTRIVLVIPWAHYDWRNSVTVSSEDRCSVFGVGPRVGWTLTGSFGDISISHAIYFSSPSKSRRWTDIDDAILVSGESTSKYYYEGFDKTDDDEFTLLGVSEFDASARFEAADNLALTLGASGAILWDYPKPASLDYPGNWVINRGTRNVFTTQTQALLGLRAGLRVRF